MVATNKKAAGTAIDRLEAKADRVAGLAKTQRITADAQRESSDRLHYEAHKLEVLGRDLEADLAELKRDLK